VVADETGFSIESINGSGSTIETESGPLRLSLRTSTTDAVVSSLNSLEKSRVSNGSELSLRGTSCTLRTDLAMTSSR
jgi:hypothetical protein